MKKIIVLKNFLLVLERCSRNKDGPLLIRTSGYTATEQAVRQSWIWTQLRTIPHSDRSQLPDPAIAPQNGMANLYKQLDCTVYNLYFRPQCKGLRYAIEEASEFFDLSIFPGYKERNLIGHSKGGLFMGALTKELHTKTNIVMISPTFGTIMGDEEAVFRHYGKFLNLDKKADGMVSLDNQRLPIEYGVNAVVELTATHPTILKKAVPSIVDFLKN